jgi:hypothetical protein
VEVAQVASATDLAKTNTTKIPELIYKKSKEQGVDANLTQAIAFCESTNRQFNADTGTVLRGKQNPSDVGLFQINERYHLKKSLELGFDIYTVEGNIDYALWLIKTQGVQPWKWSQPCWSQRINSVV